MSYYTRVFCKSDKKPLIGSLLKYINANCDFVVSTDLTDSELSDENWSDFELFYGDSEHPILIEYNYLEDDNGIAREEIDEFMKEIGEPGLIFFSKKKKVIQHLNETK